MNHERFATVPAVPQKSPPLMSDNVRTVKIVLPRDMALQSLVLTYDHDSNCLVVSLITPSYASF